MKIKIKNIEILLEGQVEDLVQKYPKLKQVYDEGMLANMKPSFVQWIAKQDEPPEDVVSLVPLFIKQQQRLSKKDINQYTSSDLSFELESLGKSKSSSKKNIKNKDDKQEDEPQNEEQVVTEKETTVVYKSKNWLGIMPHTTKSSIYWSNLNGPTTWCTGRTQGQNLFLSYVLNKNVVLYYLLNLRDHKRDHSKLSIGFVNGNAILGGERGGISVDSKNNGLTEKSLKKILGNEFSSILNDLKNHNSSIGEIHPAKKEMKEICSNVDKFSAHLNQIGGKEYKLDWLRHVNFTECSDSVLFFFLKIAPSYYDDYSLEYRIRSIINKLATESNNNEKNINILINIPGDLGEKVRKELLLFSNKYDPHPGQISSLITKYSYAKYKEILKSKNDLELVEFVLKDTHSEEFTRFIFKDPQTPNIVFETMLYTKYFEKYLSQYRFYLHALVTNPNVTTKTLSKLFKMYYKNIQTYAPDLFQTIADKLDIDVEILKNYIKESKKITFKNTLLAADLLLDEKKNKG